VFTWQQGAGREFRLAWSSNPRFQDAVVTSDSITLDTPPYGIGAYQPTTEEWNSILRLARTPDFRQASVFWRVTPLDAPESACSRKSTTFDVPTAQKPVLRSPPDGEAFSVSEAPPTISWFASHNDSYQVRFSSSRNLSNPLSVPESFSIANTGRGDSGDPISDWEMPAAVLTQIGDLAARNEDRSVYYAVFAKDRLGRISWSAVRRLEIQGGATSSTEIVPRGIAKSRSRLSRPRR
jgi:hypothetical protein